MPTACQQVINITLMQKKLKAKQQVLVDTQAMYYNKKYKPMIYKVRNKVYLNSKNIKSMQ